MASHFSICFFVIHFGLLCITFSSAAIASWQEEFEMKIESKMNKIETKNIQLEGKVTELEAQLDLNVSIQFCIVFSS